jgi:cytochrome c biogenesis protein CcdA
LAIFVHALNANPLNPNPLNLALLSAGVLGFRHGFDYDHIAAISDITSVEPSRKQAMRMGLVYVLGHAFMVALLGGAVILFQRSLPRSIDNWAERAVGLTLVVLGIYVLATLLREKAAFVPRSRASMLIGSGRWLIWRIGKLLGDRCSRLGSSMAWEPRRRVNCSCFFLPRIWVVQCLACSGSACFSPDCW